MPRPKPLYKKPSQDELARMIASSSISAAAHHFCGTTSAHYIVREWCEEYNIPIPKKRIRRTKWAMPRPTCRELEHVLQTTETMKEIAEIFDVSISTIYTWMKYFQLRR